MQLLLVACLWVAAASPRASAADTRGLRLFRVEAPWAEGRRAQRAPPEQAARLAAVELASARLVREPARIDPETAEEQHAERNQPQAQRIEREEAEEPQRDEERHPDETTGEFFGRWWDTFWRHFWTVLFSMMLQLVLMILIAIFYKHKVMLPEDKFSIHDTFDDYSEQEYFSSSIFACHEEPAICLWSCCCPAIRWADTASKMKWMGFWAGFCFFVLMIILVQVFTLSGLSLFIWLIFSGVLAYYRGQFRKRLQFADESVTGTCLDLLAYACCQCCAIAQEARHLKRILKSDLPA